MASKLYIGLVGEKLAGKDEVSNFLIKKYGARHIRFTHILDEILNLLNLPISRRNEIDLGLGLRKIFGDGVLGKAVINKAKSATEDIVVINGIRMDEMIDVKGIGAKVIYVTASSEVRFERYQNRHEKTDDATMTYEQFVLQDQKEPTEIGIPELGKQADFKIENTGSMEELYAKVENIVTTIR